MSQQALTIPCPRQLQRFDGSCPLAESTTPHNMGIDVEANTIDVNSGSSGNSYVIGVAVAISISVTILLLICCCGCLAICHLGNWAYRRQGRQGRQADRLPQLPLPYSPATLRAFMGMGGNGGGLGRNNRQPGGGPGVSP